MEIGCECDSRLRRGTPWRDHKIPSGGGNPTALVCLHSFNFLAFWKPFASSRVPSEINGSISSTADPTIPGNAVKRPGRAVGGAPRSSGERVVDHWTSTLPRRSREVENSRVLALMVLSGRTTLPDRSGCYCADKWAGHIMKAVHPERLRPGRMRQVARGMTGRRGQTRWVAPGPLPIM